MNKIPVRMSRLAMAALFVLLGGIAQAAQTKYLDELAYISATGNLGNRAGVVIEKDRDPRAASDSSNVFYTGYRLEPIADDGYFPSINNLGEMVYEKYDSTGNINVFSTLRGWITFSTSGAARGPDINDSGEVVFCDSPTQTPGGGPWTVWSTVRGSIGMGCSPSINNKGEIVWEDTQSLRRLLQSTTRGILTTASEENTTLAPEVNDDGEVVYQQIAGGGSEQIFSTKRGEITFFPEFSAALFPTINNAGDIIYTARDSHGTHLFSSIHGRITDRSLFGYPQAPNYWTGSEPFGLYFLGIGVGADINNKGQIVFAVVLVEGPHCDERGCFGVARIRLYLASPVIPITIDIHPGDFSRPINPRSQGVIPVAILTTNTFDATTVDPATVHFGRTGSEAPAVRSAIQDVDRNGTLDMILFFNTQSTGITCGDTSASLTGKTFSKVPIQGSDAIVTVGCTK